MDDAGMARRALVRQARRLHEAGLSEEAIAQGLGRSVRFTQGLLGERLEPAGPAPSGRAQAPGSVKVWVHAVVGMDVGAWGALIRGLGEESRHLGWEPGRRATRMGLSGAIWALGSVPDGYDVRIASSVRSLVVGLETRRAGGPWDAIWAEADRLGDVRPVAVSLDSGSPHYRQARALARDALSEGIGSRVGDEPAYDAVETGDLAFL